jgi:2-alkenal reductase
MKTIAKYQLIVVLLWALIAATACSASVTPPATTAVDTDEIAETVLAKVESRLAQQAGIIPATYNGAAATVAGSDLQASLVNLYQRANPAVVYIVIPPAGSGSGFVYSQDGHIVTNNHVVEAGRSYEIVFSNGERHRAELVGTDVDSDLAVLKVDKLPAGVELLSLADPDSIQVGQFVVAIGNPFGEQGSMSLGIVSGLGRSIPSQRGGVAGSTYSLPRVIQTDAPINPGNSGGPLLNLAGEVVGINAMLVSRTGINSGVGFSIPVDAVRQIVPDLIKDGEYVYSYMGAGFDDEITISEQSSRGLPQTRGVYVISVVPGSPADEAGLIAANRNTGHGGDLIVKIDDQEINDFSDLNSYLMFHTKVGQMIALTVLRDGNPILLSVTLSARP